MPGSPSSRWSSVLRIGILAAIPLAILVMVLWGRWPSQVEAAVLAPEAAAVYQTKDKLLVTIGLSNPDSKDIRGTLRIELIGPDGKSLGKSEQFVRQSEPASSYRFELPASALPADKLQLHCTFEKQKFQVPLANVILAKAHETSVSSSQEFHAGSTAAIRCGVRGVKSYSESVPLLGASVEINLRAADGKVYPLHAGKTDGKGMADTQVQVPALPAGSYKLEIATKSALGEEKLEKDVKIKDDARILLVTDKPLYQPGQVMHIRALALHTFDLKPVAGSELVFEVEDAKGNKVFKKPQQTSDHGIAAVDFQLADEVNMGSYRIRALLGQLQSDKTVTVKKYVLPKFKVELKADKSFYMPKETIKADLQSDYFFGKPVANSKIKVVASTFDVQFKDFQTWEGQTDANGHAQFEIKLPDYFVGQPLQKGDALVRLEVKLTDTADHTETIGKTYPVSEQPIRVSLIPEGGKVVPGMENRIFVAAIYPDGSPAQAEVKLWAGANVQPAPVPAPLPRRPGLRAPGNAPAPAPDLGAPLATVKTNEAGLAEFRVTPKPEQFRQGDWAQRTIEVLGGNAPAVFGPSSVFDVRAEAVDARKNKATATVALNAEPFGENVLLRLDKAIYRGGDRVNVDVRTSAGLPTVYLDVVRGGQTLLTRWFDVKDGQAAYKLELPATIFGTIEIHAYQMLASGIIIRDSRVVYVQPREDLKIDVKASKDVHKPGEAGQIRFQVTDAQGKAAPAALGVIIVDESVYALQEMQPGLEKVYFTLQEELIKPQAQAVYQPNEPIDLLVRQPELPEAKQQIAQVLLTSVRPKLPARWDVEPALDRRQKVQNQVQSIGMTLFNHANSNQPFMEYDAQARSWRFQGDLLTRLTKAKQLDPALLTSPFGKPLSLADLAHLEKDFTVNRLAQAFTQQRMVNLHWSFLNYTGGQQTRFLKDGKWTFPDTVLADALKQQGGDVNWLKDSWGEPIRLVRRDKKIDHQRGQTQFDYHELVSSGPDRKPGTDDDVRLPTPGQQHLLSWWWVGSEGRAALADAQQGWGKGAMRRDLMMFENRMLGGVPMADGAVRNFMAPAAPGAGAPVPTAAFKEDRKDAEKSAKPASGGEGGAAPPMRIREYFPETLLWRPALITDDKGVAVLPLTYADSITTWRLSASASSKAGLLGGVTVPLRVFQDFFVDLDLPVSLTQNDEVAFPVAVYNYLKEPQTVKLDLQPEAWFELIDEAGPSRALSLKPNEVTAVKFRIKARKIGFQPLTVKAAGSKMSDAIKRVVEVVPDGTRVEQVFSDRLAGRVSQTVTIPEHAIPDSAKLLVKVYPGVFSQVMEGMEGMLRLPGG